MFLRILIAISLVVVSAASREGAIAGAFLEAEGQGQFIAGVGYSEGSRSFDNRGRVTYSPNFQKAEASGYLEYGLKPWITLIAAPTLSHMRGAPAANTITGSDSSAVGARVQIYGAPGMVVAIQGLFQPPIMPGDLETQIASGGARTAAGDVRLMYGQAFQLFGLDCFVDLEPGVRIRSDPFPNEARFDIAVGGRPWSNLLMLVQNFNTIAPPSGLLIARRSTSKVQLSAIYDLSRTWSIQLGAFYTVAGQNIVREAGPIGGIWYRF